MKQLQKNFAFIHIPKTAGISIIQSFKKSNYPLLCEVHKPYSKMNDEQRSSLIFFSVVRNPFDRIFSFYHFFLSEKINRKFLLGLDKNYQIDFEEFVNRIGYFHKYIKPAWDFISLENQIMVNEILYFERLNSDFNNFCEKYHLNIQLENFHNNLEKPQLKKENIYKLYQIKLIEHVFRKDFDNFGYSYDSWVSSDSLIS